MAFGTTKLIARAGSGTWGPVYRSDALTPHTWNLFLGP